MSLSTLMTRFESKEAQESLFRLAILTEPSEQIDHQYAVAETLSFVARSVTPSIQLAIFSVGDSAAFRDRPAFTIVPGITGRAGQRWNTGLQAIRAQGWDAVLFLSAGSVVNAHTVKTYAQFMRLYFRCLSSFDQYFIEDDGQRVAFWTGFTGQKQGISTFNGRCIHRGWLDTIDWTLWSPEATNAEDDMQARLDGLKAIAAHSGEHRIFGCIAHELAILTLRNSSDGFFDQSGESAQTQPVERSEFFDRFFPGLDHALFQADHRPANQTLDGANPTEATPSIRSAADPIQQVPGNETSSSVMGAAEAQKLSASIASAVSALAQTLGDQKAHASSQAEANPTVEKHEEPKSEDQWIEQGEAAFGAGDVSMAELCFQQALNLNPLSAVAHNDLAVTYHTLGKLESAERHYLKAISFDPQSADAFVGLVTLSVDAGRIGLALRYVAQGLRRDPSHGELLARAQQLGDMQGTDGSGKEVSQ